jgi:hypothetical protein
VLTVIITITANNTFFAKFINYTVSCEKISSRFTGKLHVFFTNLRQLQLCEEYL